jgi:hypothetical protein
MPVSGGSIGNHIAENRESVQRDRPLPSSVGASSIIKIESEPILDAYSQTEAACVRSGLQTGFSRAAPGAVSPTRRASPGPARRRTAMAVLPADAAVGDSARTASGRVPALCADHRDPAPPRGEIVQAARGLEGRRSAPARRRLPGPDEPSRGGRMLASLEA